MKTFCPNCEKDTECEFTAELYECKECGEDFAKYIVGRTLPAEKSQEDETFAQLKVEQFKKQQIETLQLTNDELRKELKELRFEASEQRRFIGWVHDIYSMSVRDTCRQIEADCTYESAKAADAGKYGLPMYTWAKIEKLSEMTLRIHDGAYLDAKTSTVVKRELSENQPSNSDGSVTQNNTNPDFNNH